MNDFTEKNLTGFALKEMCLNRGGKYSFRRKKMHLDHLGICTNIKREQENK